MRTRTCFGRLAVGLGLSLTLLLGAPARAAEDAAWAQVRKDYREARYEAALEALERMVAQRPEDREAHYYVALVRWRQGRFAEAAVAWHRVQALDPKGPFGRDAELWLSSFGELALPSVAPSLDPPAPVVPSPVPTPVPPAPSVPLRATTTPPPRTPWLTADVPNAGSRARSRNARPGWFKALDGTFEFIPPARFVLLDEGEKGGERRVLFGPASTLSAPLGTEQPPTLLIVWRDVPALMRFRADQRVARARQLLMAEAVTYGPGIKLEGRFGVQAARVAQREGSWAADTWLFFQGERLYAVTYGGDARSLSTHQAAVGKSLTTFQFNP